MAMVLVAEAPARTLALLVAVVFLFVTVVFLFVTEVLEFLMRGGEAAACTRNVNEFFMSEFAHDISFHLQMKLSEMLA